ncbi:hypothetical protein AUEXF2481DRAFT_25755 [Aureobasidium subglaciale EXF-2481]|uniref:Uncharacterized protein n=1 Tax=Aureobasidium subglaciale (strain EXF-2481) TaxID=1043005 RepID=A0A074YUN4_AURSE|nr:uncharacterized protein AUEXF2481DRAFT_25755 [Aureobasidium subglaciale EXF-2481]KAI5211317.1 hypothetical protein E4T38_01439 [Aureobasidium subglaciale]KAI5229630.1 hypothetical protein E4T40_01440 [Aureobasidium subglaciale]KAI5233352.1 hypothetical protein E4T41_01437 [Aureobasidium subglaciale]KAI5266598.1 hypothetical protein E4T46_01439 [Aureobasidium subglaciale]KEQ99879.1 hypothetical protein AUEXF2481DRAFT_25755 [Aureobasidium subglaciale EXF-2481]
MALSHLEVKPSDLQLCDKDGCDKWWPKADYEAVNKQNFQKCPHCREVDTNPTKYWTGGFNGPKEPGYHYPAAMPPHSARRPDERQNTSSVKRGTPIDTSMATSPTPSKKPKLQQAIPNTPTNVAAFARMERKDSLNSNATSSPTTSKSDPNLETLLSKTSHLYEAWKKCKGQADTHLEKELREARSNLTTLQTTLPKVQKCVEECENQLSLSSAEFSKMETFWTEINNATAKADLDGAKDRKTREEWQTIAHKHVHLAWEENDRRSRAHSDVMNECAKTKQLAAHAQKKVTAIEEERQQLKVFGEFLSGVLPSKNIS